jgi:hypothetical protein
MTTVPEAIAIARDRGLLGCTHERKVLVESGYEREWEWTDNGDGTYEAFENYPSSYSEEGNGEHRLVCKTCLKEFPLPDDWVEGVNFA